MRSVRLYLPCLPVVFALGTSSPAWAGDGVQARSAPEAPREGRPTPWQPAVAVSVGARNAHPYDGPYLELAVAAQATLGNGFSARGDVFYSLSFLDDAVLEIEGSPAANPTRDKGTVAAAGVRVAPQWAHEWVYVRVGGQAGISTTKNDSRPCGRYSKSTFSYGTSFGAGLRVGPDHRLELGPRADVIHRGLVECSGHWVGERLVPFTAVERGSTTVVSLQVTYVFW